MQLGEVIAMSPMSLADRLAEVGYPDMPIFNQTRLSRLLFLHYTPCALPCPGMFPPPASLPAKFNILPKANAETQKVPGYVDYIISRRTRWTRIWMHVRGFSGRQASQGHRFLNSSIPPIYLHTPSRSVGREGLCGMVR